MNRIGLIKGLASILAAGAFLIPGEANGAEYTIKKGDTLWGISKELKEQGHNVSVEDLRRENPKVKPEALQIGQNIQYPDSLDQTNLAVSVQSTNAVPSTNYNVRTMELSQEGLRFIARHEGLRTNVYNDVAGIPTIGYGHVIRSGESYTNITLAQAETLLLNDVQRAVNSVRSGVNTNLTQGQFDALVSFVYNTGNRAFNNSTLRRRINEGDEHAPEEFDRWVNAGGRRIRGLVNRREAERRMYEGREQ